MSPAPLLITGGTGYLGAELIRQAIAQGQPVAATYHTQAPPPLAGVTWHALDLRDPAAVQQVVAQVRPYAVIHTAFRQYDPDLWAATATGAGAVAQAAWHGNARLIHLSSDVIFDGEQPIAYTEADPPNPISAYGEAKAAAEQLVRAAHPQAVLVRTSLIYGFNPIDRHTRFILEVADGVQQAALFHDELRCPVFVGDLAAALLELVPMTWHGILNVAGGAVVSRYQFGQLLAAYYGRDPQRIVGGYTTDHPVRRPRNCALDLTLARSLLSTPLRGVPDVLRDRG